jgi:Ser/Thr protein kinase RdoA (MazF antagonist)
MSAKINIASSTHSTEELAAIVLDYTTIAIFSTKQLFGGYSGSSYLITLNTNVFPTQYVLKVSNGYSFNDAEFMCRTAAYLGTVRYRECCLPVAKNKNTRTGDDDFVYVSQKEKSGIPSFLLTYVEGQQADKVMRDSPDLASVVMRGIGGGLGKMHASSSGIDMGKAQQLRLRWYETDGGCCDVQEQYTNKILEKIMADSDAREHEFVSFYQKELADLKREIQLVKDGKLGIGITHGDPFADNVMSNPDTGELVAFIDMEDVCVGPLLFDLACCAIGCCFKEGEEKDDLTGKFKQVLDFDLLSALLEGYCGVRKLPILEVEHLVAYMRLTLLCNTSWRFVKFNIMQKEVPEEAKNSYYELQERIKHLHKEAVEAQIMKVLNEC